MNSETFLLSLPEKVDPNVLEGLETNFHFILKQPDGQDPNEITVQVHDGQVTAEKGLKGEPKCVVKTSDENLMKLLKGDLNPMMAILTGKLKISNQSEMLKYAKIFGLM
ncbi:SCP2 sterol-binding domain-containing protein [Membranicola marinus]|uniref:SCP2 sterol-binding domain-containing protein n=1 Tax=Membranihabitans marinus TaxID=1227546 RepID=A0A953LEK1_9BACT|nr:SCP2 sterol-binding domain-containing protein [Membranihabitans marinus]MBY5960059.1 SCP2 sterol-binding domain-containing protein [Membranihabitans marinus]